MQKARSRFQRLGIEKREIPKRTHKIEAELAGIEVQQLLSGSAEKFGKRGRAFGAMSVVEGEIRKSRLQDELRRLIQLDSEIDEAEKRVWDHERSIPKTIDEMTAMGCNLR